MEFFVRKDPFQDDSSLVTIQDGEKTVFNLKLPDEEDNVDGWKARLGYLKGKKEDELENLLRAILNVDVSEDAYPTYRNALHAVCRFLQPYVLEYALSEEGEFYVDLYKRLERFLFRFRAERQLGRYVATLSEAGKEKWRFDIPCDEFDVAPVQVCQVVLAASYHKESRDRGHNGELEDEQESQVHGFIENYTHFQAGVAEADPTTIKVFASLSKALVDLIRLQFADLGMYVSVTPEICAFIVKNEQEGVEEQKTYLEPILNSPEDENKKLRRLNEIIQDIKGDICRRQQRRGANPSRQYQKGEDGNKRLMQVISLISEHYLNLYDLERSSDFWEKAESKDPVLHFFLILHQRPCYILFPQLGLLGILSFFACWNWSTAVYSPLGLNLLDWRSILMLTWYASLLMLLFASLVQVLRRRWLYSQLLLPRLVGASIVGLAVLLLDDLPWRIGVRCSLATWLLVTLFTYLGSFLYVFIEIYNTTKFVRGRSIKDALRSSKKVFLIGLSETLFIVTIASSLVFPVVDLADNSSGTRDSLGICVKFCTDLIPGLTCNWMSFSFYPGLVSLWTGVALFIGSFVQLMWQEKQITAPV